MFRDSEFHRRRGVTYQAWMDGGTDWTAATDAEPQTRQGKQRTRLTVTAIGLTLAIVALLLPRTETVPNSSPRVTAGALAAQLAYSCVYDGDSDKLNCRSESSGATYTYLITNDSTPRTITQPESSHSYGQVTYLPSSNQMVFFGGGHVSGIQSCSNSSSSYCTGVVYPTTEKR